MQETNKGLAKGMNKGKEGKEAEEWREKNGYQTDSNALIWLETLLNGYKMSI